MASLMVTITRFADDHFPGFVECSFVDVHGHRHTFIEKVPLVSTENLLFSSTYPRNGLLDCAIDARFKDNAGHDVVRISEYFSDNIDTYPQEKTFIVFASQVVD